MVIRKTYRIGKDLKAYYYCSDSGMKIQHGEDEPIDEYLSTDDAVMEFVETDIPTDELREEAPDVIEKVFGGFISYQRAVQLAPIIQDAVQETQSDEDALDTPELYPKWAENIQYAVGQRVRYNAVLYRVVQAHTSQEGWEPNKVPALFTEVARPGEIPEWKQPTGAQDAYMAGDKVRYNEMVYESLIDNNIWSPEAYPAGWKKIGE